MHYTEEPGETEQTTPDELEPVRPRLCSRTVALLRGALANPRIAFLVALALLVAVNLVLHCVFAITQCFGEPDAARVANDAIKASYNGSFSAMETQAYSTPLYLDALRWGLGTGLVSIATVPVWMTAVTIVSSAIITMAVFVFVYLFARSLLTASAVTLLLQFNPAFFMLGLYGFAVVPAIALFFCALVAFQVALPMQTAVRRYLLLSLALVLYVGAVLTKIDVVLATLLFCLPIWSAERPVVRKLMWTGVVGVTAVVAFVLFNVYAGSLAPAMAPADAWGAHTERYFVGLRGLIDSSNLRVLEYATGYLSVPLGLLAVIGFGWWRKLRTPVLWLFLGAFPLVLYWAMIRGNSARHVLLPVVILCVVIGLPLTTRFRRWWLGAMLAVMIVNGVVFPPSQSTVTPSGRVFQSAQLLESDVKDLHATGGVISELPYEKTAVIGQGWTHPYFIYEILRDGGYEEHALVDAHGQDQRISVTRDGRVKTYLMVYNVPETEALVAYVAEGYFLVIADSAAIQRLRAALPSYEDVTSLQAIRATASNAGP